MKQSGPYAISLSRNEAGNLKLTGGKGAGLAELIHGGFNVPPGFCLTTISFREFITGCRSAGTLYDLLDSLDSRDLSGVRDAGQKVRESLEQTPFPSGVKDEVLEHWKAMGETHAYAVRSSATAEDLPDASFAGQQDTYLNIIGEQPLLQAIKRSWISLFTDRAILYRQKNDFSHRDVEISVVVQKMIMSEVSGIMFTADPLTGHRGILSIDAGFGLGEALVGGIVTPDSYKVVKKNLSVKERHIADKEIAIYPVKEGGTVQEELPLGRRNRAALSDRQIIELAETGCSIESHYNKPQDIEWAFCEDRFYILQSRPITSLYPLDGLHSPDGNLHVFFSMGHQQSMTRALAPLSLSILKEMIPFGHSVVNRYKSVIRVSGGRVYIDLTPVMRHPILKHGMLKLLSMLDALAPIAVRQIMKRREIRRARPFSPSLSHLKFIFPIFLRMQKALWKKDLDGFLEKTNKLMDDFIRQRAIEIQEDPPGIKRLQSLPQILIKTFPFFLNWVPEAGAGMAAAKILTKLAGRWLSPEDLESLTLGIPGNAVNEMNRHMGDLADLARLSPALTESFKNLDDDPAEWLKKASAMELSAPFMAEWDAFLSRYGARGPSEIDIAMARWYEDPTPLLRVISQYLNRQKGYYNKKQESLIQGRRQSMEKLLSRAGKGLFGPMRIRLYKRLYYVMVEIGGMREHHKFLAVRVLALIKEELKHTALRLRKIGKLESHEDIWFLTWPEVLAMHDRDDKRDWSTIIESRRVELDRFQKLNPPIIITSEGETPSIRFEGDDLPEGSLRGLPVSSGLIEGIAHVIEDPHTESLAPGEILVARFTDPGWTPLFINAAGLILEVGGTLTHGSVVAREYGIPAVVGVRNATALVKTGQRVRIDGNRGIVEILDPSSFS